jgi:aryl-alcohol dehydrogenase-like predicted oxidoreductase
MSIPVRKLGELEVSAVGLGLMGMSQSYGVADRTESLATINAAIDTGVTLLDTANIYGCGHNEELLAEVLRTRRDEVVLATKFGIVRDAATEDFIGVNGDPAYVHKNIDASLRRLGVEHIDLYYQHRVDPNVPVEDTHGALGEAVKAGKIRYTGISEANPEQIRAAHAAHPLSALQSEWSLWTRYIEPEILPVARELGIGVVPYSPLGRGFLTGAITSKAGLGAGDARLMMDRFDDGNFEKNLAIVEAVKALAEEKGVKAGQIALAWVLAQGNDVVPIPGTKRRTYLAENIAAASIELTAEDLASIEKAAPKDGFAGDRALRGLLPTNIKAADALPAKG